MTPEQAAFWKPYTDLIGIENFECIKGTGGFFDIIKSKHYCGMDTSGFGPPGEHNRNVAIHRYNSYQEMLAKEKLNASDIETIFTSFIEKPYFDTELVFLLTEHEKNLSLDEYWELVVDYWCLQEFTTEGGRGDNWRKIFSHRERPSYLTEGLNDSFIAYRAGEETGFSWTLDKKVAEWFHQRFVSNFGDIPLLQRTFQKEEAVFYTNRRNEQEVVIVK